MSIIQSKLNELAAQAVHSHDKAVVIRITITCQAERPEGHDVSVNTTQMFF